MELKRLQHNVDRLSVDNEQLNTSATEYTSQQEMLDEQRRQLKKEVKELMFRENRNIVDYSELEEENISLQKQVPCFIMSNVLII